jgi:large subunit ribosomal protein L3
VFTKNGKLIPVTVIAVEPNVVTQIKTVEKDGYNAIQLGFDTIRESLSNKPKLGHLAKANTTPKRFLREIRGVDVSHYELGQELKANVFNEGELVDVTGISKGKGFQGNIKRHNQSRGPMGHGSQYHRGVGSLGTLLPARVLKGKKLPGHMGSETTTIQNLEVIQIDLDNNIILVKGNIPGPKKALVIIKSAIKKDSKIMEQEELISYVEIPVEEATREEVSLKDEIKNEEIATETTVEIEDNIEESSQVTE